MIKVVKTNNKILITGHAGSDEYGKDIVCASVSSIVYTTINAITKLGKKINVVDDKDMLIEILSDDETTNSLIDNMLELLKSLENDYPKNIKVKEN